MTISFQYKPKTDEELRQMAIDILGGRIFCDWMFPADWTEQDAKRVFTPLSFLRENDVRMLKHNGASMLYEYTKDAMERSTNGYPSFLSFRWLNLDDTNRLKVYVNELQEYQKHGKTAAAS